MRNRSISFAATLVVLALVALVYAPVRHGGFIWDDQLCFHDAAWLRSNEWTHYVFRDFCEWSAYFRPLAVLIYVAQMRAFDAQPSTMHLVSLGIHLANTLLVGALAARLWTRTQAIDPPPWSRALPMLCYGLHPALVEPVTWVGCQYDLGTTFFMLSGLLCNLTARHSSVRALCVSSCFFLAACEKEAAVSFPLLLVLFDLAVAPAIGWHAVLRETWRRQRAVYIGVLAAGLLYLALRYFALGDLFPTAPAASSGIVVRLQQAASTYLHYWRLILWPMTGTGPIHPFDATNFDQVSLRSFGLDTMAFAILGAGVYGVCKRRMTGYWIAAVTAALLPVLNLAPVTFTESLYHDRYAENAIAMSCVLLPSLIAPCLAYARTSRLAIALLASVWLVLSIADIRVTVPLWTNELNLWQWALREHPDALTARDRLLYFYVTRGDFARARTLADALVEENAPCPACMLNAAIAAIAENDTARAERALDRLQDDSVLVRNPRMLQNYVFLHARLLELKGNRTEAEDAYRDAMTLGRYDPRPQLALALLLAREGRIAEARAAAAAAMPLFASDERPRRQKEFDDALAAGAGR